MEHLEAIGKIIAIVGPILLGLLWVLKRIEKGQNQMIRKINKIDKHKVSYKVCDQRRAECPCKPAKETETMRKIIIALTVIAAALLLPGCSHNTGAFTLGTRINLGIDPQNATANASYTDGLNVIDVSRENASWDVEIDADNGVSVDDSTGTVKGVKRLRRDVGPQITGYLVDLSENSPEAAASYIETMKLYWQYRLEKQRETNSPSGAADDKISNE